MQCIERVIMLRSEVWSRCFTRDVSRKWTILAQLVHETQGPSDTSMQLRNVLMANNFHG